MTKHLHCLLLALLLTQSTTPGGEAAKKFQFSRRGVLGEIVSDTYKVKLLNSGKLLINTEEEFSFEISLLRMWRIYQIFPHIAFAEASVKENPDGNCVSVEYKYFWNEGRVCEKLEFFPNLITVSYSYSPSIEKDTRGFCCCIWAKGSKKPPEGLSMYVLGKNNHYDGLLLRQKGWKGLNRHKLKSVVLGFKGRQSTCFLVENTTRMTVMGWPRITVDNSGTKLHKRIYKPGEKKVIEFAIRPEDSETGNSAVTFMPSKSATKQLQDK